MLEDKDDKLQEALDYFKELWSKFIKFLQDKFFFSNKYDDLIDELHEEEIIDDEVHRMMHQFEDQLKMQGIDLNTYCQFTGTTHEDMHKQMEPEATKRVKYRYLIDEVANAEKIEVSDEEASEEAGHMAEHYGMEKDEFLKQFGGLEVVKYDLRMHKALDILSK